MVVVWRRPHSWSAESVESGESHPRFLVVCFVYIFFNSLTFFAAFIRATLFLRSLPCVVVSSSGFVNSLRTSSPFIGAITLGFHSAALPVHLSSLWNATLMASLHFSFLCVSTQFPSLNGCIFASTSWVLLLMYSLVLIRIDFADSFEGRATVLIMAVDRILFMFTFASLSAPRVILFFILVCCILLLYLLRPDSASKLLLSLSTQPCVASPFSTALLGPFNRRLSHSRVGLALCSPSAPFSSMPKSALFFFKGRLGLRSGHRVEVALSLHKLRDQKFVVWLALHTHSSSPTSVAQPPQNYTDSGTRLAIETNTNAEEKTERADQNGATSSLLSLLSFPVPLDSPLFSNPFLSLLSSLQPHKTTTHVTR